DLPGLPDAHPLEGAVHPLVVPLAADLDEGVLVAPALAALPGPPGEVEHGEVALLGGTALDGVEARVLLAQAFDLEGQVLVLDLGRAAVHLEAAGLVQLDDG